MQSIFGKEIPFTVIGEATEAEAKADCEFLGLPLIFKAVTWVKAICD